MQHHSQHPAKGARTATAGYLPSDIVIDADTIQRHIDAGKRLQAEAVAAFLRGGFARVAGLFQRPQRGDAASKGAVPHRA